jgi:hypothetical protein
MTRRLEECFSTPDLLQGIHDEMQVIKDWQNGFMFFDGLRFFDRIPGGLRTLVQSERCLASFVFSNMGTIEKYFGYRFPRNKNLQILFGNMRLNKINAYSPCRRRTYLSFVAVTLADQMEIFCKYDRKFVTEEQTNRLFELMNDYLNDLFLYSIK